MIFLKRLMGRIAEANLNDVQFHPETEIQEGEVELGVLQDEDLRRLYIVMDTLAQSNNKKAKGLLAEYEKNPTQKTTDDQRVLVNHIVAEKREHEILKDIFWQGVAEIVPQQFDDGRNIGIRKGWKIVAISEPKRSEIVLVGMPMGMMFGLR